MKKVIIILLVLIILLLVAGGLYWYFVKGKNSGLVSDPKNKVYDKFPGVLSAEKLKNKKAVVNLVSKGSFEIELYPDAPKAVSNFIFLSEDKFYDEKVFYKVTPGVRVEGGTKWVDGKDGVNYKFEDELGVRKLEKGSVAMANSGPNSNGSRFFVVLGDNHQLPDSYTILGKIISGQDVVEKLQEGDMIEDIKITSL